MEKGDRIGTLAWNNRRHLELYFGVPGMGMVCHTLNPRLAPDQLVYIVNHASDRMLFIEKTFVPLIAKLRDQLTTLRGIVLLGGRDEDPGIEGELLPGGELLAGRVVHQRVSVRLAQEQQLGDVQTVGVVHGARGGGHGHDAVAQLRQPAHRGVADRPEALHDHAVVLDAAVRHGGVDGLGALGSEFARLTFTDSIKPSVMTGQDSLEGEPDNSYRYLIMPMRI